MENIQHPTWCQDYHKHDYLSQLLSGVRQSTSREFSHQVK